MKRTASLSRKTKETSVSVSVNLDGTGNSSIETGIGFFDHMLDSFSRHSGFDVDIKAKGDLHIDAHHTIEDVAIVFGKAVNEALGDKVGIARFGESRIPMDEALAETALDIGGRGILVMNVPFYSQFVGNFPTQMTKHFFETFCMNSGVNLHISAYGENDHHILEAVFKSFAYSMKKATKIESETIKSTKGVLE
ncbi:MAG: imidazoleglycerol-phosphate dehydratase HisB [Methanosarcinaceae archaeon]|nr:imidazoleglycerol-phosphate dehydratase HisB [Methanosarcinaceae archaeon]